MSRHRKIQFSRSKAILVAAGALSVATAASATAATWTPGPSAASGHAGHAVRQAASASSGPRLAVTDQLARPSAGVTYQLTSVTLAQRTYQLRAAESRDAVASPSSASPPSGSPQQIAAKMLGSFGWSSSQFACLDPLWAHESGWSVTAENPSGAYGIPQALPGSKMASGVCYGDAAGLLRQRSEGAQFLVEHRLQLLPHADRRRRVEGVGLLA